MSDYFGVETPSTCGCNLQEARCDMGRLLWALLVWYCSEIESEGFKRSSPEHKEQVWSNYFQARHDYMNHIDQQPDTGLQRNV
jgi:hypothetical protein